VSAILPLARLVAAALAFGYAAGLPLIATLAIAAGISAPVALMAAHLSPAPAVTTALAELALGAALGFLASLPVVAARLGGALSDARAEGPARVAAGIAAGLVLFGAGLDRALALALGETFLSIPPGEAALALKRLPLSAAEVLGAALSFAARVGWPALAAALAGEAVAGLLSRAAPPGPAIALPREAVRLLGLLAGLAAISYAVLEASALALQAISGG
jgi:flagellar biosynthesis protein FliR